MPKNSQTDPLARKYECVPFSRLPQGRRGKHHDLVRGIMEELKTLPTASAMKIPLKDLDGVTLENLRSAVHRATTSAQLKVQTSSDQDNFYIWKLTI